MSLTIITISPDSQQSIQGNVVIMHGWGATAEDAAYFSSLLDLPHLQLILPEGPFQHTYSDLGRMWYAIPEPVHEFRFQADLSDSVQLQTSRRLLQDFLVALPSQTGVPLERTILGGFSQGGAMTIEVGLDLPLAGLMVLSGYLHKPVLNQTLKPNQTLNPATILQVHGTSDPIVPLVAAQKARDALRQTGATVEYEEIPNMGHEISQTVLNRMQSFIQTQLPLA